MPHSSNATIYFDDIRLSTAGTTAIALIPLVVKGV